MGNKTVLVTGTSSGLGLETAKHFLANGWNVIGISRRNSELVHKDYRHFSADISDRVELDKIFLKIYETTESIDVVVNNAAAFEMLNFKDLSFDSIDRMIDVNLKGAIYVTKLCLPKLIKGSRIIFINSVAGLREIENQSAYCASKHGLKSFAGVLGQDLRRDGIKVATIHPGGINTPLWNIDNPYPCGEAKDALDPKSIVDMIHYISVANENVDFKSVTMFPSTEWH